MNIRPSDRAAGRFNQKAKISRATARLTQRSDREPRRSRWIRERLASTYRCQRGAVAKMPLGKPRCGAVGVSGCEPQCEVQCEPQNEVQCEVLKRLWKAGLSC